MIIFDLTTLKPGWLRFEILDIKKNKLSSINISYLLGIVWFFISDINFQRT
jgi:hypothetical protein